MLRYVLRRALWTLPTLVAITLLAFAVIAQLSPARELAGQQALSRPADDSLPTFINTHPRDVRSLAEDAVDRLDRSEDTVRAGERLVRLGGAALPFVLPRLDALSAESRLRVASALEPVACRMGLVTPGAFSSGTNAVVFWNRFWEERAVDFKSTVVRRAVRRFAMQESDARRAELVELDTFAIEEIVDAFGVVETRDDVVRVSRLSALASHIASREDSIDLSAAVRQAQRCAARWRSWWLSVRSDYVALAGPSRLAATVLDTRYGRWAMSAGTLGLGMGADGAPILSKLQRRGWLTLLLAACSVAMAYLIAVPAGLVSALRRDGMLDRVTTLIALALHAIPPLMIAAALLAVGGTRRAIGAAVIALGLGLLAPALRNQRSAAVPIVRSDVIRTARAIGVRPLRLLLVHAARPSAALIVTLAVADLPAAFTGACVVERILGLRGISGDLVTAVMARDVPFLMAFGVCSAALASVLLITADVVCCWLDPRVRLSLMREAA